MKEIFKRMVVSILTSEAKLLLARKKPVVIAVTGSVGKTSTKDMIYTVLKDTVHTRKSQKSFNSDIGVPLSVLGLKNGWSNPLLWGKNIIDGAVTAFFAKDYPKVLVLETGVDRPGDMAHLTHWLKPDVVVLTRFPDVPVHVEYFSSPAEVVTEKMTLVGALRPDGIVIYNNDDATITKALAEVRQPAFGFGRYAPTHFTASHDTVRYENGRPIGTSFSITHVNDSATINVDAVLGVQAVYTAAAAAAVGTQFGLSMSDIASALSNHEPAPGRMRLIRGKHDTTIVDDTYNSSPAAAEKSLQALAELKTGGRKIAILGDMLELGRYSVREHERIGAQVAGVADLLITVGVRARKIAETALENGLHEKCVLQYDEVEKAADEILSLIKPGDVILVKASQGIRAERIVKRLMARPDEASNLLVRQEEMWERR